MPVTHDLRILTGDTWRSPRWAVVIGADPVDLTDGWSVKAQIRAWPQSGTAIHSWGPTGVDLDTADVQVGGTTLTTSTVRLRLTAAQTAALGAVAGVWDLEISHPTFDNGELYRKTLVTGRVSSTEDVTR